MTPSTLTESALDPRAAVARHYLPAGEPWLGKIRSGQIVRIVDLEGNQSADTLFYNCHDTAEHYSATVTMTHQGGIYLSTGTQLMSNLGRPLLTIVADTCGGHDTVGGACSAESNMVRYALATKHMHSCRDNFLHALLHADIGLGKRDLTPNINFFMNVPVTEEGTLKFADGLSGPGKYVEMRAEMDVWMLVSNCPQLNNPCNAWNPTPVEFLIWDQQ